MKRQQSISKENVWDIVALTPMQEGMLFHYVATPTSEQYFEQLSIRLQGEICLEVFHQSWEWVVQNNEMLRAVFSWKKLEKPVQIILKQVDLWFTFHDFSEGHSRDECEALLEERQVLIRKEPFDLEQGPLFRIDLCKMAAGEYVLIISNHHILYDGWSNGVILREFFTTYERLLGGEKPTQLTPKARIKEYVKWLMRGKGSAALEYWGQYLRGFEGKTMLPLDYPKLEQVQEIRRSTYHLPKEVTNGLNKISRSLSVTVGSIIYTAWGLMLQQYNNSADVVFGTTVAIRPEEVVGSETLVGLCINTVPLRITADGREAVATCLKRVSHALVERKEYESTPLVEIKLKSELERQEELFDSLVVIENYPLDAKPMGSLRVIDFSTFEMTNYDLTLGVMLNGDSGLELQFIYNSDLFRAESIEEMREHFTNILWEMVNESGKSLSELNMLSAEKREQVVTHFNAQMLDYPKEKTIHQLFGEQVQRTPNAPAVSFSGRILSYRELNAAAERVCALLRQRGIRREEVVGLVAHRSLEFVVGMLGILKAGGAYLPINPDYPVERIQYMLADSGSRFALTNSATLVPAAFQGETIVVELDGVLGGWASAAEGVQAGVQQKQLADVAPEDAGGEQSASTLAYVIYTSGSTGLPKGVMVEHRSLVNFLYYMNHLFSGDVGVQDNVLSLTNISFDVSVCELFLPLVFGGKLVLFATPVLDVLAIAETIRQESITFAYIPPTLLREVRSLLAEQETTTLNKMLVGVESIKDELLEEYVQLNPAIKIINGYGPTEATICATMHLYQSHEPEGKIVTIGQPLANTEVYILDKLGRPQPVGTPGELTIAGVGLARGYLNRPELTAEKFVPNPFKAGVMYKTGDLARWQKDGTIEFLGRLDDQVKIRGFRIEPGEIEALLLSYPAILKAAVIPRMDSAGLKYLCAYYVLQDGAILSDEAEEKGLQEAIRAHLSTELPEYMIPSYFIRLDALPLTPNGKVDRKALPAPEGMIPSQHSYRAPENELEEALAKIWSAILGREKIGTADNFFELGGHSLKATQLSARIYRELKVELPLSQIFTAPTIREQAECIEQIQNHAEGQLKAQEDSRVAGQRVAQEQNPITRPITPVTEPLVRLEGVSCYPISSAQRRMFLLNQLQPEAVSYNMPGAMEIKGELDLARLEHAFHQLILRHEALRTSFGYHAGEPVQRIHDTVEFSIQQVDGINVDSLPELVKPFDLAQVPLLRVTLCESAEKRLLFFDMHHIISDGVSMNILVHELLTLYAGAELPELPVQYRDFAVWQNEYFSSEQMKEQEAYWLTQFTEEVPVLELPLDYSRTGADYSAGEQVQCQLPAELRRRVKKLAQSADATPYMIFLAVYNLLLAKYSGQEELVIGSPIAGRQHPDIQGVLGVFINTLPMRNRPVGEKNFAQFLTEVKSNAVKAYEHQDYPFETLVEKLNLNRDTDRNPLFDVSFVQENDIFTEINTAGLSLIPLKTLNPTVKFDLTLTLNDELNLKFSYRKALFRHTTIVQMARHYLNLLNQCLDNPELPMANLEMLTAEEKEEVIFTLNQTTAEFPAEKTLQQIFEEQAAATPAQVALILTNSASEVRAAESVIGSVQTLSDTGTAGTVAHQTSATDTASIVAHLTSHTDKEVQELNATTCATAQDSSARTALPAERAIVTYQELNQRANQLAHTLRQRGVGRDKIVALMVERSLEMMVGILAILKAGGAYLPIDPSYPAERVQYMLADSGSNLLLTKNEHKREIDFTGEVLDLGDEGIYSADTSNPTSVNTPTDLAYILYTSGSTGRPKGVMIEQRSLINTISHLQRRYPLDGEDIILQSTIFTFDASVREIFWWFFGGATLCLLPPDGEKDPHGIVKTIAREKVTLVKFVPILLNEVLEAVDAYGAELLTTLKYVLVGGEALTGQLTKKYYQVFRKSSAPTPILCNVYGPTETTIHCTEYEVSAPLDQLYAPIGRPISNDRIYVLDKWLKPVPRGVFGEIYIAGTGVARAYLNQPTLNSERFLTDPFHPGEWMYKSGDAGRWLIDGNVEFGGRIDQQVKIRGHRIELGEIEERLTHHPEIAEAVVVAREEGASGTGKELFAYYTGAREISVLELREHLAHDLPDYMIPLYFMHLETLPLTVSGKVDRKVLPAIERVTVDSYVQPTNHTEIELAQIWAEVLNLPRVGIADHFFAIGGHSLKATAVVTRIYQKFGVNLPLRTIFKHPTIRELAVFIQSAEKEEIFKIEKTREAEYYPVSSAQRRLFVLSYFGEANTAYNMPGVLKIEGTLERDRLEEAFKRVIERHTSFRTYFEFVNGEPVQRVHPTVHFAIENLDSEMIYPEIVNSFIRPFDLAKAPLLRVGLANSNAGSYLVFDMHHIISDGISMDILVREVGQLYTGAGLPPQEFQYTDYTMWQDKFFQSELIKKERAYWLSEFSGEIPVLNLPTDHPRPVELSTEGDRLFTHLPKAEINKFIFKENVTLYQLMLSIYTLTLSRYTGQKEIIVGSPIAGRPMAELANVVGMFVNTLALKTQLNPNLTFSEFLTQVKEHTLTAYEHQNYPFEMLVEELQLKRDTSRNPLFDVMLVLQNTGERNWSLGDVKLTPEPFRTPISKFDLSLAVVEEEDLALTLEYSTNLFERATIERFMGHFSNLLQAAITNPSEPLFELEMLSAAERVVLLEGFNATTTDYPREKTLGQLFRDQVQRTPEQIAVSFEGEHLTYRELDMRTTELAIDLRSYGVGRDSIVGLILERSLAMSVVIMAIIKAGGAYLPISPDNPLDRIEYMLKDSAAQVIITEDGISKRLNLTGYGSQASGDAECESSVTLENQTSSHPEEDSNSTGTMKMLNFGGVVITLGKNGAVSRTAVADDYQGLNNTAIISSCTSTDTDTSTSTSIPHENFQLINQPTDLAYIIYTSGSTGRPKGVMIEHHSAVNRLNWMQKKYPLTAEDTVLQKTPYTFDVSVWELFWALLVGARICFLKPGGEKEPAAMIETIAAEKVTTMHFVPSMLGAFLEYVETLRDVDRLQSLTQVFASGEALKPAQVNKFNHYLCKENGTRLYNLYGPTEATVDVTYYDCPTTTTIERVPIGRPIDNTKMYILSPEGQIQPIGVPGELCIAGVGLARGYLMRPELTAEKFTENPAQKGERIYRTGDLARWLPDGNIEYLGRLDYQVKIRGFRIEIGEIEARLLEHSGVREVIVIDREGRLGDKYLAAYYLGEENLTSTELRAHLSTALPDYMIPSYFIRLDAFPLTSSGKTDRKALPEPELELGNDNRYEAPQTPTEMQLAAIWADLLEVERVGREDNFFDLGGHSLKAIQLVARVYKEMQSELPLGLIFKKPLLKDLAEALKNRVESNHLSNYQPIPRVAERLAYPLSSAQKRIYVIQQVDLESTAYNMPGAMWINGTLECDRLAIAFNKLIDRHEAFRTTFRQEGSELLQIIHPTATLSIEEYTITPEEVDGFLKKFIQPFDLSKAPLLRVALVQCGEKKLLVFDAHHIITDGQSLEIMVKELALLYNGDTLIELPIHYKDFAIWQNEQITNMGEAKAYWLESLAGELPELHLPLDYRLTEESEAGRKGIEFSAELTQSLQYLAKAEGTTLYMILFAAYTIFLGKYTGQSDIIIGSPVAGRNHPDIEHVLGMFVNTLALRSQLDWRDSFKEYLKVVKENTLKALEHQDYPFERLIEDLQYSREEGRHPIFETIFNLQNRKERTITMPEIQLTPVEVETQTAKFQLILNTLVTPEEIYCEFQYSKGHFKSETVERMVKHWEHLLIEISAKPDTNLANLTLLTPEERELVLNKFNATDKTITDEKGQPLIQKTAQQLFSEQVAKTPNRPAVHYNGTEKTYTEIYQDTLKVAHLLKEKGVTKEQIVALMLETSFEMVSGTLGVLFAGGAYLPIDPNYPEERIKYLLEDSATKVLLTQSHLANRVSFNGDVIYLDKVLAERCTIPNPVELINGPEDLAYIIYTSGSTGKPKGVMIEQKGLMNYITWRHNALNYQPTDVTLQLFSYAFDGSCITFYGSLLSGGMLVLPIDQKDHYSVRNLIRDLNVTTIGLVPSAYQAILELSEPADLKTLRLVSLGGEKASLALLEDSQRLAPQTILVNEYGPTETTIVCTAYIGLDSEHLGVVGRPIFNTQAYILDEHGNPVPVGVKGELCMAGLGIARGYMNRAELTAEKFGQNPWVAGGRIYRTGDEARWLPDGNIELFGRLDQQVKIRGYRIEIGEVEDALLQLGILKEVVVTVLADERGVNSLAAYFTADEEIVLETMRTRLKSHLPEYMIPAYFMQLEKMPLSPNGKLERRNLPKPDLDQSRRQYAAPTNRTEERLAELWAAILGIEQVGIDDDFFELGGHSLKATSLAGKIATDFGIEFSLRNIMQTPTIRQLAVEIRSRKSKLIRAISQTAEREYYPLTSAQKRMYILQQLDLNSVGYNIPAMLEVEGHLEIHRLEMAAQQMIKRHASFRTYFDVTTGEPVQRIAPQVDFHVEVIHCAVSEVESAVRAFIRPFDLSQAPLIRMAVLNTPESQFLLLDQHHIISDGVSITIFIKEFSGLYQEQDLNPLNIQFTDYAVWQEERLNQGDLCDAEAYWLKMFSGELPHLELPTDFPRPKEISTDGNLIEFRLNAQLTEQVKRLAREEDTTLYMILLAIYNLLLAKYTRQSDIIVGTPIAGRAVSATESLIGMFVNTVAIRSELDEAKTFTDYLKEIKEVVLSAFEHQDYPFDLLIEQLHLTPDLSHNPLFDTMFVFQNQTSGNLDVEVGNLKLRLRNLEAKIAKFDLSLIAYEDGPELVCSLQYRTQLYTAETAQRFAKHFTQLVEQAIAQPEVPMFALEMITPEEKGQILQVFNKPENSEVPQDTLQNLFIRVVELNPDAKAVVYGEQFITYGELAHEANAVADLLKQKGVKVETIVGILAEPTIEMIIAICGVIQSGGAFLPLDPTLPQERLRFMLEDGKVSLLLTHTELRAIAEPLESDIVLEVIYLDEMKTSKEGLGFTQKLTRQTMEKGDIAKVTTSKPNLLKIEPTQTSTSNDVPKSEVAPDAVAKPTDLAYVIYTSGSTGKPKGVMVEHQSIARVINWHIKTAQISCADKLTKYAGFSFDASMMEIFSILLAGGELHLIDQEMRLNLHSLNAYMNEQQITVTFLPPAIYEEFAKLDNHSLRYLFIGGEKLNNSKKQQYTVANHYGPAENTICTTAFVIDDEYSNIPIGEPVANCRVYILDANQQLQPIGVVGELYAAGENLARGYLNRPELDAERFLPDPWNPGKRMYRTGDLARWLADGNLEFHGRIDHQVKIRGYRIELGEIEKCLQTQPAIKDATVIDRIDHKGEKYLCAYFVAEEGVDVAEPTVQVGVTGHAAELVVQEEVAGHAAEPAVQEEVAGHAAGLRSRNRIDADVKKEVAASNEAHLETLTKALRQHLAAFLPDYMIPAHFVQLQQIPLNQSGKVDRRALQEPDMETINARKYISPRTPLETELQAIWSEVLGVEHISIDDNFFELGGHSLKATILTLRVNSALGVELPLREIFNHPTIARQAVWIEAAKKGQRIEIPQVEAREHYPLSSAQKRLYIINKIENDIRYNMPGTLIIEGELDLQRLENAFKALIARHEVLRTSFDVVNGEPVQRVHHDVAFALRHEKVVEEELQNRAAEFIQPFELSQAPLLRAAVLSFGEKYLLIFDLHHIIADGVSITTLMREMIQLYEGQILTPQRIQYKDFAIWQNQLFESESIKTQEMYWLKEFGDEVPVLALPTDFQRPKVSDYAGGTVEFTLNEELTAKWKEFTSANGVTLYMAFLAVYNILLAKYTRQEEIVVGSPIAGRHHPGLEGLLGMFVNTLALKNKVDQTLSFSELVSQVKENLLHAYENQDYQFEMLVERLNLQRDPGRNPLFDTVFSLNDLGVGEIALDGLRFIPYKLATETVKFDLMLTAVPDAEDHMRFTFDYSRRLFKRETIERMAEHFINLLRGILVKPQSPLAYISLLSGEELEQALYHFNATTINYPKGKTIQQLFEEQVLRTPDKLAVSTGTEELTYAELNAKANQLAYTLRREGVERDQAVAILVDRSMEMLIGVLAIIKAGGAYLPIDIDYPESRMDYMLKDANVQILLTVEEYRERAQFTGKVIDLKAAESYAKDSTNLDHKNQPEDLIYLIYTSGSTGNPKGVMIEHRNVNRLISNSNMLKIEPTDRILQTGSLAFDASTFEIWGSLLNGAALYLVKKDDLLAPARFGQRLQEFGITMIWLTAPLFNQYLESAPDIFSGLHTLIVGGDALSPKHINTVRAKHPDLTVINGYGPTESTTFTTYFKILKDYQDNIPIGRPVSNTQVYILDRYMQLQPIGTPGELCISGDGLARGYLNRADLTAEKFVENPFKRGDRLYRTGDLARWLPDGTIEFMGRIDHQVKIRGFRIELGEIETHLLKQTSVKEAIILDKKDAKGNKYLVAYIVTEANVELGELRGRLAHELPDYMIPSYFISLERLPLTPNGKVDRKALPEVDGNTAIGRKYTAPTDDVEKVIAEIWGEVLEIERVGIEDNFFELGGHSLKLISTMTKINEAFKTDHPISALFLNPTVRQLAEEIRKSSVIHKLEAVVQLQRGSSGKNLFCIHPLGGAIHWYKELAGKLPEYNIFGIQAIGMMSESNLPTSVREMVATYLKEIKLVQPAGPYIITAYCAGSMLAYEMVRQLEEQNEAVERVILFDSPVFGITARKVVLGHLSNWWEGFKARKVTRETKAEVALGAEALAKEVAERQVRVEENIVRIMRTYKPKKLISSDIYLIKAEEQLDPRISEDYWAPLTMGKVIPMITPGDHFTMMQEPLVKEVALWVRHILEVKNGDIENS